MKANKTVTSFKSFLPDFANTRRDYRNPFLTLPGSRPLLEHLEQQEAVADGSCPSCGWTVRIAAKSFSSFFFLSVPCLHAGLLSFVQLFVTPRTVAFQAPLSMGFLRQNTGLSCHFLLQGISPTQGSSLRLPSLLHCRWILHPGKWNLQLKVPGLKSPSLQPQDVKKPSEVPPYSCTQVVC